MIKGDFQKLVTSVNQAEEIRRKKARPSRMFKIKPADVKAIRVLLYD